MTEVKKILALKSKLESIDKIKGKNPFDDDKKSCFISQFFYLSTQINEENIKSIPPLDYLLCDQSVLDQWIYWLNYLSGKEMTPQLEEKHNILKSIYRYWIKTYDLIFLIRMDLTELEKREMTNEFRIADLQYITKTEALFKETVEEDKLKIIEIWNNNTIDESAHEIIKAISEYDESLKSTDAASWL